MNTKTMAILEYLFSAEELDALANLVNDDIYTVKDVENKMQELFLSDTVIIHVEGGVAYEEMSPPHVTVHIIDLDNTRRTCPSCGTDVGDLEHCYKCNTAIYVFCPRCGHVLEDDGRCTTAGCTWRRKL